MLYDGLLLLDVQSFCWDEVVVLDLVGLREGLWALGGILLVVYGQGEVDGVVADEGAAVLHNVLLG